MATKMRLRATYSGISGAWHGVVKDETGRIVWQCSHAHRNRDVSGYPSGPSARSCANSMLYQLDPDAGVPDYLRAMHP